MITVHSDPQRATPWLQRVRGQRPALALVLGFTETGLIPDISAAGATPADRRTTALADAEWMVNGPQTHPTFPLPPLQAGASPALISRAVVAGQGIPLTVFSAGLPQPPTVAHIDLQGQPAQCLTTGQALPLDTVNHLFQAGWHWGETLAADPTTDYLLLAECVVGGTTTALALLQGLGIDAMDRVNSSHPICNHDQKRDIVQQGLTQARRRWGKADPHPLEVVAALGDPMQPVVAGMALAASRTQPVLLAGGTQMLAVYAFMAALAQVDALAWKPENIVVGTTRWVAADPTGDTVGLAQSIQACLLATDLSFAEARFAALRAYEEGFVKEGVGAGACAIAATLYQNWGQADLLAAIEQELAQKVELEDQALIN
ncbi:MAG: TIGR00303 family protein [Leptolyngbya sp.]|nr:TIGR00303 family protein [Leptolyngbya sp.]